MIPVGCGHMFLLKMIKLKFLVLMHLVHKNAHDYFFHTLCLCPFQAWPLFLFNNFHIRTPVLCRWSSPWRRTGPRWRWWPRLLPVSNAVRTLYWSPRQVAFFMIHLYNILIKYIWYGNRKDIFEKTINYAAYCDILQKYFFSTKIARIEYCFTVFHVW